MADWSAHHSPADSVKLDISPRNKGNLSMELYPKTLQEYKNFYNLQEGGDPSPGREINAITGEPY